MAVPGHPVNLYAVGAVTQVYVPVPTQVPDAKTGLLREVPPAVAKRLWLSVNTVANTHRHLHATITRSWRYAARDAAEGYGLGLAGFPRARVVAEVHKPRGGHYDPANLYPVFKACLDGFVDAGVFPDDDHLHVVGPDPRHGAPDKAHPGVLFTLEVLPERLTP